MVELELLKSKFFVSSQCVSFHFTFPVHSFERFALVKGKIFGAIGPLFGPKDLKSLTHFGLSVLREYVKWFAGVLFADLSTFTD